MIRAVLLALALMLVGCASAGGELDFDDSFSETERSAIVAGFVEWPATAPEVLRIVRVTDENRSMHPDCVDASEPVRLGVTSRTNGHICFFVDDIARDEPSTGLEYSTILQAVAAHEYGHALGLEHVDEAAHSIMRPALRPDVVTVQAEDVRDLDDR